MTYNVFGVTLNLAQSISRLNSATVTSCCRIPSRPRPAKQPSTVTLTQRFYTEFRGHLKTHLFKLAFQCEHF